MTRIGESPSEEHRKAIGSANTARAAAIERLIANHASEYAEIHKEERRRLGLADNPSTIAGLRQRVQALEQELAESRAKELNVEDLLDGISGPSD